MVFNLQQQDPNFRLTDKTLTSILRIYNTTPHETLSQTMHFDVTPEDALKNKALQDEIVRRWMKYNYDLVDSEAFTDIEAGMRVWVYQPHYDQGETFMKRRNTVRDKPYTVVRCNAGNYVLRPFGATDAVKDIIAQRKDFVLSI